MKGLLKDNFWMVIFIVIAGPIYWKWRNGTEVEFDQTLGIIFIGLIVIFNLPSVILYLNYYFENKDTEFTIDNDDNTISIKQNQLTKTYTKTEIEKSTYHLGIYYKNAMDKAGRLPMFISDFGYWDITFKNGDRYYLTNLLHDFLHDKPKIKNTKYRFRFFQYINKSDSKVAVELKEKREKTRTQKFVEQYKNKTETQLNEILNNESKYQKEAVEAVRILLRKKTLGNNGYSK